jgi:hypothetical protein
MVNRGFSAPSASGRKPGRSGHVYPLSQQAREYEHNY